MHLSCMRLGIPGVLKHMLDAGHLHGDCLTVTGKTMAENLESLPSLDAGQTIIAPFSDPVKCTGHIAILSGAAAAMAGGQFILRLSARRRIGDPGGLL